MSIRTVVGDDDSGFRAAVIDVLQADPRFAVVGEAQDGAQLVEVAATTAPDLVLMDVRMPSGGAVAARALTGEGSDPGRATGRPLVVGLSADTSPDVVASVLQAGAVGFLAKGRLGASFPDLLARVVEGEVVIAAPTGVQALRHLLHRTGRAAAGETALKDRSEQG
jgi:two-component system nitrate/nitrite response regulator NarL